MPAKMYYDDDADLGCLKDKTMAIVGYGAQGHAHAQNLRDSGVKVVVSELEGTANYDMAKKHGFEPVGAEEAAKQADVLSMLVPDTAQPAVYRGSIEPNLKAGAALLFSHGFTGPSGRPGLMRTGRVQRWLSSSKTVAFSSMMGQHLSRT